MIEILREIFYQILIILGENFKSLNLLSQFSLPFLELVLLLLQSLAHLVVLFVLLLVLDFLFSRLLEVCSKLFAFDVEVGNRLTLLFEATVALFQLFLHGL